MVSGQARTLQLVLKQSPLIEVFQSVHVIIQENFHMLHHYVCHAPPDMTTTVKILCDGLRKYCTHEEKGCEDTNKVIDYLQEGMRCIQTEKSEMSEGRVIDGMNGVDDDHEQRVAVEMDDLEV